MRLIFNKADTVAPKTLLRIYGSLMWGLGKLQSYHSLKFENRSTVPVEYSNLGYSGRSVYSDLNPNGTWSSCIT